jgi:hypothetical protein
VQANFALEPVASDFTVSISAKPQLEGDGVITSSPAGINCTITDLNKTGACSAAFAPGTSVTLTATPAAQNTFSGWNANGCGAGTTCIVTAAAAFQVGFDPARYPLTIAMAGLGSGIVQGVRGQGFFGSSNINCSLSGGTTSGTCTTQYAAGKPITLNVETGSVGGTKFAGFGAAPCTNAARCLGTMPAEPLTIIATLNAPSFTVASAGGSGAGRVTSTGGNVTIDCAIGPSSATGTCGHVYATDNPGQLTLTATPNAGSQFAGWSGGTCSGTGPCQFLDDGLAPLTISANFTRTIAQVTVSGAGTGSGNVTSIPSGVSCAIAAGTATGTCSPSFLGGTEVKLTATPNAGSTFTGWTGACTGTGICAVITDAPRAVTAQFTAITPAVAVTGTGSGSVSSTPAGVSCTITDGTTSGTCSTNVTFGTDVTLTATPASGWVFAGWAGDCSGVGSCQLPNVITNRVVTASFARATLALKITGAGNGDGFVKAPSVGLNCPVTKGGGKDPDCTVLVAQGTAVTLTADPQGGSVFAGWAGDVCSGNALTCTVTLSQARNVVAQFKAPKPGRDVALSLIGGATLEADELQQLDRFGNNDGKFNLGDLLALLDRTGERLTAQAMQAVIEADRKSTPTPTTSTRRTP